MVLELRISQTRGPFFEQGPNNNDYSIFAFAV